MVSGNDITVQISELFSCTDFSSNTLIERTIIHYTQNILIEQSFQFGVKMRVQINESWITDGLLYSL